MTATCALSQVSVGIETLLDVAGLTSLATLYGDDVPQGASLPCVWFALGERDTRGLGRGGLPEIDLRVHVYSTYEGGKEAQTIVAKVIELLKDQAVTVAGYAQCGLIVYDETPAPFEEEVNGVKVKEFVSMFRLWVEQS